MRTFFFLLFVSFSAFARPIELKVTDYGWLTSFPPLRDTLDFYLQGVEDDLNEEQPILDPSRIAYGVANSSVLAAKGLGTDYANDPKKYYLSLGIGAAYDAEENEGIRDEISGVGAASSLTLGMRFDERLMGYVNFGTLSHSRILPGDEIDIAGDIDATNFGVHVRYDLGVWNLRLHTGYEFNINRIDLSTKLDERLELDTGGSGVLSGRLTGRPEYRVKAVTHSIPVELSSSVSFLRVFTLYGGLGSDFNFGQAEGKGNVKGDVTGLACSSGICVGETVIPQLQVQANYDAKAQVRSFTFRTFAGLQLDLPFGLHAFGQAEKVLGTELLGLSAGLRYTY